jgi:putative ABC transport system permease protein
MFIRKLAFSNFAVRRSRVALTVAAVALSVSLVIAVTSGYASLFEAVFQFLNRFMESADAQISRTNDSYGGVPWSVIEELRQDPDVRRADGRLTMRFPIADPAEPAVFKHVTLVGIDRPEDQRIDRLVLEGGAWFNTSSGNVAVIDQAVAAMLSKKVGDTFTISHVDAALDLKVVGIVHKPGPLAVHMKTIYVPLHTLQKFAHQEDRVSTALINLTTEADHKRFEQRWRARLAAIDKNLKIHLASDVRSEMDGDLQGIQLLSYLGSAVSMLAATFIVFSALSMGVTERQRSLAMLRAVGALRKQIGGLVVFEGMILAFLGLLIGVPLGWFWINLLAWKFDKLFTKGAVFSWGGLLFGASGTVLSALVASALPAWSATRVSPLEAMAPLSQARSHRAPIGWALIGLVLISIDPLLFYGPMEWVAGLLGVQEPVGPVVRQWKFYGHFALGLPGLFVGFFLLAPMCVWLTERLAGPIVSACFGLRFALLRQQLSTGIWRAAGTGAALMVGLAVFIVMQVTGHTMLAGWKLPDKFPDVFIGSTGLTDTEVAQLRQTPGIRDMMPIRIASVSWLAQLGGKLGMKWVKPLAVAGSLIVPDSTMFIGIDPDKAFKMMELEFRQGNAKDAAEKLNEGRWVIVTEEYHQATNCKIGDAIKLGDNEFHIAGVVWSPGIDVMVGMYDMNDQFAERTVSSVFGSNADAEHYFGAQAYIFAADLEPNLERVELIKRLKQEIHSKGLEVGDVREIKTKILEGFYRLLNLLSTVGFAAMAVASMGVTNTVMAGVRTRRWQFGILRSIGMTGGQLVRLVMAEAVLLGLIGCILGLAAGFEMTMDATALARVVLGYSPPMVIPWLFVIVGVSAVMFMALVASLWPAVDVARTDTLTLLQAGRSST